MKRYPGTMNLNRNGTALRGMTYTSFKVSPVISASTNWPTLSGGSPSLRFA